MSSVGSDESSDFLLEFFRQGFSLMKVVSPSKALANCTLMNACRKGSRSFILFWPCMPSVTVMCGMVLIANMRSDPK